jgi:hypothetical protein
MNHTHETIAILFLLLSIMVPWGYAANVISTNPSPVSLTQGSDETAAIIIDDLPQGLSGYYVRISLADPSMGKIVSVRYPQWAVINMTEGLPGASVNISGADLIDQIRPGAKSVTLADITIRGDQSGSTGILTAIIKLDGDKGVDLGKTATQTTVPTATTSAQVTTNSGSFSNEGGGGSYSSYVNAGTVGSSVSAVPTAVRTAIVQSGDGNPDPGVTVATHDQSPPADRLTFGPTAIATASQPAIPALPPGIPGWVPAGIGIIVIIVAGGLLFMTYKKRL